MARAHKTTGRISQKRLPADRFKLTDEERSMLPDPSWVTEDDADFIIGLRREREPGKSASLEQVLSENGVKSPAIVPYMAASAEKSRTLPRAAKK
jgi:hypothetical protein